MSEPAHGPSYAQLRRERDILETYVSDLLARQQELVEALAAMEEGYRLRCNYCGGVEACCRGLTNLPGACIAPTARAVLAKVRP